MNSELIKGNINGQETATELFSAMQVKYKFKYIKGSRWGINGFNSGVLFLEKAELVKLLERRKSLDVTAGLILASVTDEIHMRKIAIMSYSMGIFKLLWKTMIRKQLKSEFKNRLKAVQKFTKSIQVLSVNGDGLHFSDIQELVEVLKTGLQSDRQISLDNFLKVLSNHNDRHLIPNSEFQRKIDDKFGKMIQEMPRSDQVESLMLLCKALANSLSKIMKFYNSWFETNNDDVDHQIIPSNLEVERSFGLFKHFESKYPMMKLTNIADLVSSKVF